jgi:hypothetical protein
VEALKRGVLEGFDSFRDLLDPGVLPVAIVEEQALRALDPALRFLQGFNTGEEWAGLVGTSHRVDG